MRTAAAALLVVVMGLEILIVASQTSADTIASRHPRASSQGLCRLCRGRPRKCTCYVYKEVNGKYRCSYNDKTPCEPGAEEARQQQQARLPKYKVLANATEYFSKPAEVICGKAL